MALKRVPLELVVAEVEVAEEAGGWFELDAVLFGSFGGWMSARGLSCHCFVDSCPDIFIHEIIIDKCEVQIIITYERVLWSFWNLWRLRRGRLVEVGGGRSEKRNQLEAKSEKKVSSPWSGFVWQRKGFYQVVIV